MACYFAFEASDALRDSSNTLQHNFETSAAAPQAPLAVQVAQRYSDEIVDALLLNLARGGDQNKTSARVLETVAGIIKATVHKLIGGIISKMSNEELRPLATVIKDRRLTITRDDKTTDYISFRMPDAFHRDLREVMLAGSHGEKNTARMTDLMVQFSEMSHQAFYDDTVAPLKLGFLGRKMVEMGGAAIKKGSLSATRSLVPALEGQELKDFCNYVLTMLIEV